MLELDYTEETREGGGWREEMNEMRCEIQKSQTMELGHNPGHYPEGAPWDTLGAPSSSLHTQTHTHFRVPSFKESPFRQPGEISVREKGGDLNPK